MLPILYIIIPCYNEEKVLPITSGMFLDKIRELVDAQKISDDSRILFVNDGSKDRTWEIICELAQQDKHYQGICQSRNRGHQNAVLAGLMEAKDVDAAWFQDAYALHFCSVSLGEFPMKEAHRKAIDCARRAGCMISFDPNIRLPLWENPEALRNVIWEFAPMAHVLKISDEELEFITGKADIKEALPRLFAGNTRLVIYTKGADGAECYTEQTSAYADGQKVKAVDTTGAGDGFIGAFLFCMAKDGVEVDQLASLSREQLEKYLAFANKFCAKSITKYGAIASYPTLTEM